MMYVILRSGKVLQYNTAGSCTVDGGALCLDTKDGKFLVARIPLDVVERAEWERPCAVMREVKDIRKKKRY